MKTFKPIRRAPKPAFRTPTLADVLLAKGQRLRATESMTATTVSLNYAAKWAQGGAR